MSEFILYTEFEYKRTKYEFFNKGVQIIGKIWLVQDQNMIFGALFNV